MTKYIDWSKAPEDATHYDPETCCFCNYDGLWYADEKTITRVPRFSGFPSPHYIERPNNTAKIDRPTFTQAMADAGKLPPVGSEAILVVVEYAEAHDCVRERSGEVFDIVAHHGSANGLAVAVSKDCSVSLSANHMWFKPIDTRTDEEKAKDGFVSDCLEDILKLGESELKEKLVLNMFKHGFEYVGPGKASKPKDVDVMLFGQKIGTVKGSEVVHKEEKPKDTGCSYTWTSEMTDQPLQIPGFFEFNIHSKK